MVYTLMVIKDDGHYIVINFLNSFYTFFTYPIILEDYDGEEVFIIWNEMKMEVGR